MHVNTGALREISNEDEKDLYKSLGYDEVPKELTELTKKILKRRKELRLI